LDVHDADTIEAHRKRRAELLGEIASMPEKHVYFSLFELRWCADILQGNEQQLLDYLGRCEGDAAGRGGWPATEHELTLSAREVSRLLLNYIASARSLVEHADGIHRQLFANRSFPDYAAERKACIEEHPLVWFVRELRNHILHEAVPAIVFESSAETGSAVQNRVCLSKRRLRASSKKWRRGPAKDYLDNAPESIALSALASDYGRHVKDFYEWYRERALQIWRPEYVRHRPKVKEFVLLTLEDHVDLWLKNPQPPCRDVFFLRRLIDEEDLRDLERFPHGSRERTNETLALLAGHLAMPERLADKLRRALGTPDYRL
jgi:hypothetical protein